MYERILLQIKYHLCFEMTHRVLLYLHSESSSIPPANLKHFYAPWVWLHIRINQCVENDAMEDLIDFLSSPRRRRSYYRHACASEGPPWGMRGTQAPDAQWHFMLRASFFAIHGHKRWPTWFWMRRIYCWLPYFELHWPEQSLMSNWLHDTVYRTIFIHLRPDFTAACEKPRIPRIAFCNASRSISQARHVEVESIFDYWEANDY